MEDGCFWPDANRALEAVPRDHDNTLGGHRHAQEVKRVGFTGYRQQNTAIPSNRFLEPPGLMSRECALKERRFIHFHRFPEREQRRARIPRGGYWYWR